jgi:hypothetical protein
MLALRNMARHNPQVLEYIQQWRHQEMESLPHATTNVAVQQGRCQVLGELIKLLTERS